MGRLGRGCARAHSPRPTAAVVEAAEVEKEYEGLRLSYSFSTSAKLDSHLETTNAVMRFFFYMEMHLFFYIRFSASQSRPTGKSLHFPWLIIP